MSPVRSIVTTVLSEFEQATVGPSALAPSIELPPSDVPAPPAPPPPTAGPPPPPEPPPRAPPPPTRTTTLRTSAAPAPERSARVVPDSSVAIRRCGTVADDVGARRSEARGRQRCNRQPRGHVRKL